MSADGNGAGALWLSKAARFVRKQHPVNDNGS